MDNEEIILEDVLSEEYLDEMAQFKPVGYDGEFNILVLINPEKYNGNCYFKAYNNCKCSAAIKVARFSFTKPELITGYAEIGSKKSGKPMKLI